MSACECIGGWIVERDGGSGSARRCPACKPSTLDRLRSAGVPPADLLALTERPWRGGWPTALLAPWPDSVSVLTLIGCPGSGKTRIAVELMKQQAELNRLVRFLTAEDLLAESKSRMGTPDGAGRYLKELMTFGGILVLDDCWAQQASEYNDATISQLVRRRHSSNLPLIITTNLGEAEIEREEPRLASRLGGSILLPLAANDWRRRA
jgi:chromosomal replication initiation ATPase DnaA